MERFVQRDKCRRLCCDHKPNRARKSVFPRGRTMTNLAPVFDEGKTRLTNKEASSGSDAQIGDWELIESYVSTGSGEPFAVLLRRHWSLVYGVACRRTGNATLAQ